MTLGEDLILKRLRDEVGLPKSTSKRIAKKLEALAHSSGWATPHARRRKLPSERNSITHKFIVGGHAGFITVGVYPEGTPGELHIRLEKENATLSGVLEGLSILFSIALEYGVPLKSIIDKFIGLRFEPSGYTTNPEIRFASSLLDYVGRYLGGKFISRDYCDSAVSNELPSTKQTPVQIRKESKKSDPKALHRNKTAKRN